MELDDLLCGIGGNRIQWEAVPPTVRREIETRLGSPVLEAITRHPGFSPALAASLYLADGRTVFVKAIGPDEVSGGPGAQESYRREARNSVALEGLVPAPRLLDTWDAEDWVVLAFEHLDARHPQLPWQRAELDRVLDMVEHLGELLTPSPIEAHPVHLPGSGENWQHVDPYALLELPGVDRWVLEHLDQFADLEAGAPGALSGSTLLHEDIRADNLLLDDREVWLLDWPHVGVGAAWVDLAYFLPSVAMQGGPPPQDLFRMEAAPEDLASGLAFLAGYFLHSATQPPPPGLPFIRRFQLAQGIEALRWLRTLL